MSSTSICACPGDTLSFNCEVIGGDGGVTIWTGTAFDCHDRNDEIILLHGGFMSSNGTYSECNNGAIMARSLGVKGSNYTSQLTVSVTSDLNGKTIMCIYDSFPINKTILISTFDITGSYNYNNIIIIIYTIAYGTCAQCPDIMRLASNMDSSYNCWIKKNMSLYLYYII